MENFEKQGGVAFLILFYSHRDSFYYLTFRQLKKFWDRQERGGRKSFRLEELDRNYFFTGHGGLLVPYLELMQRDLDDRD